ncbi:hypothetical protein [Bradyrhizobium sp.]|uniref:hypothetical protein n=1 Tax=Bradyrhizobium sp. TaxID=376 RepID=UPI003C77EF35
MTELAEQGAATNGYLTDDAASQMTKANKYALYYLADARNVWLDEMLFAGNEVLDRAITETKLFNEFLSKMAGAHSVKDLGAMYQECARHQLDFIRRDTERLMKHSERVIDNTSKLVESWRQN